MFAPFWPGVVTVPVMWPGGTTVPAGWPTCKLPRCNALVCIDLNNGFRSDLCLKHFKRALQFQEQIFPRHRLPPHNWQQTQPYVTQQRRLQPEQHHRTPSWSDDETKDEGLANEAGQDPLRAIVRETETMILFWGPLCTFSQWATSTFYVDDTKYCSLGQYMAACKAALFDDQETLRSVLDTEDLEQHSHFLDLKGANFDQELWDRTKKDFALMGNYQKFKQNPAMCEELVATRDKVLVAASSLDNEWSAGLDVSDPEATRQESWTGKNLLGKTFMNVRRLMLEKPEMAQRVNDTVLMARDPVEGNDQRVPSIINGVILWV